MAFPFLLKGLSPFFMSNITSSLGLYSAGDKNQILDPISTSIRMSLLIYKPMYTKISIDKNRIYFQEPTIVPGIQGFLRKINGDQRSDIHIIILSIEKLLNWYKISDKKIRYICDGVIKGLEKLSQCYSFDHQTNLVSQAIDFFIDKIKRELGEIHELSEDDDDSQSQCNVDMLLSDNILDNSANYEFFKTHWNKREVMIVYNQLKELEIDPNPEKRKSIIQSIENFLSYKDDNSHKYFISLTKY